MGDFSLYFRKALTFFAFVMISQSVVAQDPARLSAGERVQGVEAIWNEAVKSFPFRERLTEFKRRVELAKTRVVAVEETPLYYVELEKLVATLNDGHTFIRAPAGADYQRSKPSVGVERIDGIPLVTWVRNDLVESIPLGSRVISVNSRPIDEVAREKAERVSASTVHRRLDVSTSMSFEGQRGTDVSVEFVTPRGEKRIQTVVRGGPWPDGTDLVVLQPWRMQRTDFRAFDEGRLVYFAARNFEDKSIYAAFLNHLQEMQNAQVVIIDIRKNSGGNSSIGSEIMSHFLEAPLREGRSRVVKGVAVPSEPTEPAAGLVDLPRKEIEPKEVASRISARLVLLTDHDTLSAAEDFVSLALAAGATQVGEVTAGSTGEMVRTSLPGGGTLFMVSKWDQAATGAEFVGHGFVPSVEVVPTREALIAGTDPALERAIAVARQRARQIARGPAGKAAGP